MRLRINSRFTLHPPYIISHFIGPFCSVTRVRSICSRLTCRLIST